MCRKVRVEGRGWGVTEEGWWCEKVERECYKGGGGVLKKVRKQHRGRWRLEQTADRGRHNTENKSVIKMRAG